MIISQLAFRGGIGQRTVVQEGPFEALFDNVVMLVKESLCAWLCFGSLLLERPSSHRNFLLGGKMLFVSISASVTVSICGSLGIIDA